MNDEPLPGGDFSAWMTQVLGAIQGEGASEVPCGSCTACCTASQFVHIGPDETDTLSHIDPSLVFPAPGLPRGHVVLGHDERGHCPMLIDGKCSIYRHRPRTCRTYDCRIFPAAALQPDEHGKAGIAAQARRWQFSHPTEADRTQHAAVRAAAVFIRRHSDSWLAVAAPTDTTQLAVSAIEVHDAFIGHDQNGETTIIVPPIEAVRVELTRRR